MATKLSRKRRSPNDKLSDLLWEHADSYTLTPADIANGWFEHTLIHPRIVYKLLVRCRVNAGEYPFSSMIVNEDTGLVHVTLGGWETVDDDIKFQYYYRHGGRLVPAPDPVVGTLSPDTGDFYDRWGSLVLTETNIATALSDDDDETYLQNSGFSPPPHEMMYLKFTEPHDVPSVGADNLSIKFRIALSDDGGDGETRFRISMYDTESNGDAFYCTWQASLPIHGQWYDEGLPLVDQTGDPGDHWWEFQNFHANEDDADLDDPWPDLTALIAAGNLTCRVSRVNSTGLRPWTTGWLHLAEFSVTWT